MTKSISDPSVLFLKYWKEASTWKASLIANVERPTDIFKSEVLDALCITEGKESAAKIEALVNGSKNGKKRGRKLVFMEVADQFFYQIHPRALYHSDMSYVNLDKLHWLRMLQAKRTLTGCYCELEGKKLIPRGPLTREFRPITAANAECFRDRFHALSAVECVTSIHDVPVGIAIKVRLANSPQGIVTEGVYKDRSVAFMPLAEDENHLSVVQRSNAGVSFVDFKAAPVLDVATKTLDVLGRIKYSDIVMAPELIICEPDSKLISSGIRKDGGRFRAFVAGSGHTVSTENSQAWNESKLFNGSGALVFSQRKLWLADISLDRAEEFGLDTTTPKMMEDNASGEELIIADLDGFGRCIILICQDLNATPLAEYVIGNYQPDWVFVPILDVGVTIGRWFHQSILALSNLSPSRFLVSSSLSLAKKASYTDVGCGLAFGPLCEYKSEKDDTSDNKVDGLDGGAEVEAKPKKKSDPKRVSIVEVGTGKQEGFGVVNWDDVWVSTRIKIV